MSVLIKGMEMPQKTYAHCMLIKDIDGSVQLHVCTKNSEEISEWEFFDLVPVSEHGRLIDADALMEKVEHDTPLSTVFEKTMRWYLQKAPTIIEAEESKDG